MLGATNELNHGQLVGGHPSSPPPLSSLEERNNLHHGVVGVASANETTHDQAVSEIQQSVTPGNRGTARQCRWSMLQLSMTWSSSWHSIYGESAGYDNVVSLVLNNLYLRQIKFGAHI